MQKLNRGVAGIASVILFGGLNVAHAATVSWVDWEDTTDAKTAVGSMAFGPETITVTFTSTAGLAIWKNGEPSPGEWTTPNVAYDPWGVTGAPNPTDIVRVQGSLINVAQYQVSFSRPVLDPVLAMLSVGYSGFTTSFAFDSAPTLLSEGQGKYGGGPGSLTVVGNTVSGQEGNGVIVFPGEVTSISWTIPQFEACCGQDFTVGAYAVVPIPTAIWLFGSALGLMGWMRRKELGVMA